MSGSALTMASEHHGQDLGNICSDLRIIETSATVSDLVSDSSMLKETEDILLRFPLEFCPRCAVIHRINDSKPISPPFTSVRDSIS